MAETGQLGWLRSAGGVAYPPEPWSLTGALLVSAFRVPRERGPAPALDVVPGRHTPVVLGGQAIVGVAFAHYAPGGVLQYEELLVALPVRRGAAVRNAIPDIWVTSEASQHGGRELWGIPKRIGAFERAVDGPRIRTSMSDAGAPVASLDARVSVPLLPGHHKVVVPTAQRLDGREMLATNFVMGRVRALRTRWSFAPDGPLGWLAGATPVASFALTDAAILFGARVRRS